MFTTKHGDQLLKIIYHVFDCWDRESLQWGDGKITIRKEIIATYDFKRETDIPIMEFRDEQASRYRQRYDSLMANGLISNKLVLTERRVYIPWVKWESKDEWQRIMPSIDFKKFSTALGWIEKFNCLKYVECLIIEEYQ